MTTSAGFELWLKRMDIVAVFALVQRVSNVLTNILLAFVLVGTLSIIAKQGCTSSKVVDILEADLRINVSASLPLSAAFTLAVDSRP